MRNGIGTKIRPLARVADSFVQNGAATLAACVIFFVIVPLAIYCLSYIPYLSAYGEVKLNLKTFERIWNAQVTMFEYHKNLVATHYFSSPWYEWPLIIKPMWYYSAAFPAMGKASTIMAFGNPAVWWTGLVAILFVLGYSAYRNALPMLRVTCGRDDAYDRAMPVIAVGFLVGISAVGAGQPPDVYLSLLRQRAVYHSGDGAGAALSGTGITKSSVMR